MARLGHGKMITAQDLATAQAGLAAASASVPLAFAAAAVPDLQRLDFLFAELQSDPAKLLETSAATRQNLVRLGQTMQEDGPSMSDTAGDSQIPAAYTYFGQFVDHDITFELAAGPVPSLADPNLSPMSLTDVRGALRNARTATLDLDSVYGFPAPRVGDRLTVGKVTPTGNPAPPEARPAGKSDENDLPRQGASPNIENDRAALIGDPRNDENTLVSQLHVAFLRAHNALVDSGLGFDDARRTLRQHYQHIVIDDFLKRIVDPTKVDAVVAKNEVFDAMAEPFFLPLEFSVAAYRFGHTMVRGSYNFNLNFNRHGGIPATLGFLFTFTALSGQLGFPGSNHATLPENWIVEWPELIGGGPNMEFARALDTRLVEPLFALKKVDGKPEPGDMARLAVRNLLRGYLLRMPTGQAVAAQLGLTPLTAKQIEAVADKVAPAPGKERQVDVVRDGGFSTRTPLWYYLLAEAAHGGGQRLGPVGGTIVAEVLVGLVRRSDDSILRTKGWAPTLPSATPGRFDLSDLLRFAGVL